MADRTSDTGHREIVLHRRQLSLPRLADQLGRRLRYRRYSPEPPPFHGWTSYADYSHIRDIALDGARNLIWLATWGGVLALNLSTGDCTHHTSEHGLPGNSIRRIVIDRRGVVWASGERQGLCSLSPESNGAWQVHDWLNSSRVLQMFPAPEGGIYAALRKEEEQGAVALLTASPQDKPLLLSGGVSTQDVSALLLDNDGGLWTGNLWGLHRYRNKHFDFHSEPMGVRALALGAGGAIWAGTYAGLYRFDPQGTPQFYREPDWPLDEVVSMLEDPLSGDLWVITTREVGRIINQVWQPVRESPPGRLNVLQIAEQRSEAQSPPSVSRLYRANHAWVGGAEGLFDVGMNGCTAVFPADRRGTLSNAVQSLYVDDSTVYVGTARGLFRFDGQSWTSSSAEGCRPRDVRSIVSASDGERIWVGAWNSGLYSAGRGDCSPDLSLKLPIVSLAAGADGTLWAATIEEIYVRERGDQEWTALPHPAGQNPSQIIQAICYQQSGDDRHPALWVGTSHGLLCYRPRPLRLWDFVEGPLEHLSIQCMALDPLDNRLWVGTPQGLFSGPDWERHSEADVRAIAFGPPPEADLWVGTASHLERRDGRGKARPLGRTIARMGSTDSGLAADEVTALAVRAIDGEFEVWVGSPLGLSSYRYGRN